MSLNVRVQRLAEAEAFIEEATIQRWHAWRSWITASRELNVLRATPQDNATAFDRDTPTAEERIQLLEDELAVIPPGARETFQRAFEAQRLELLEQERADKARRGDRSVDSDPHVLDLQTFDALLVRCMSDPTQQGRGGVPMERADGEAAWFYFDTAILRQVPKAETFALSAQASTAAERRKNLLALVGVLVIGVIFYSLVFAPTGPAAAIQVEPETAPAVLINDAPLAPWAPIAVRVADDAPTLALTPAPYTPWPRPGASAWRQGTAWPVEICLPRDALPIDAAALTLSSAGAAPERRYRLAAQRRADPDLILSDCAGDPQLIRYGVLERVQPLGSAAPGATQTVAGAAITLTEISIVGPGDDPTLTLDTALVTVSVRGDVADWEALRPTLILPNGENRPGSRASADAAPDGMAALRHLIPLPTQPLTLAWELTDPATGAVVRWRTTAPAPLSRAAYLQRFLEVASPSVRQLPGGGVQLQFAVTNTGATPLTLRTSDIEAAQAGVPLTIPPLSGAAEALPVGVLTPITLDLLVEPGVPFTVTLAGAAYTISLPSEGR
jgi:hypothetical protein